MITHRPGTWAPATNPAVPPLDDELEGLFEDLYGFNAGLDLVLDGLRNLALERHTEDSTKTMIAVLAGNCPNITTLIARLVARLGDADQNPALHDLPGETQDAARELTSQYAAYDHEFAPRQLVSETCAVIDGI